MLTANSTRLVGPILSCEKEVHIQSWTQLIDWRVMDTVLPIMSATCEPGIDWDSVIDKEVAIGVSLLREGFSLAGLHRVVEYLVWKTGRNFINRMPIPSEN